MISLPAEVRKEIFIPALDSADFKHGAHSSFHPMPDGRFLLLTCRQVDFESLRYHTEQHTILDFTSNATNSLLDLIDHLK